MYHKVVKFNHELTKRKQALYSSNIIYELNDGHLSYDQFIVNLIILFIYYGRNSLIKLKMIILFTKKHKKILKVNKIILIYFSNL